MADSITWLLNADASQVRAEMNSAMQSVGSATTRMAHDLDGVTTTHSSLLRSDHRVAASLRGLATEALTTGDAFATVGKGMESLAMATNVSLPALIGLEVLGTLIAKIAKAHSEAVKLNKELDDAGKPRDKGSKLPVAEDVAQRRATIKKAQEDIEEKKANPWVTGTNWIWKSWDWVKERNKNNPNKYGAIPGMQEDYQRRYGKGKSPQASDLEIEERKTKAAEAAADAIERQAEAEKVLAAEAKGFKEKLQLSLAEIAKEGVHRKSGTFDSGKFYGGDVAQRAMDEEKAAKKAILAQDYQGAIRHQSLAEQLKSQIPGLKDSEKITTELVTANITLKEIEKKVSFSGK